MKDLRVYFNTLDVGATGEHWVFYSRRGSGPFYRWLYEGTPGRWRFSRVRPSRFTLRALCVAHWNAVPTALQLRLDEHYLD